MSEEIKMKMLKVSAILFKNNVPVDEAKLIGSFIEQLQQENTQLKQENQMLKLTIEKLTYTPYEYGIRGN